jgi:acetyl esterase/lipase
MLSVFAVPVSAQTIERLWLNRIAPSSTASTMTDTVHNPYVRIFLPASGTANGAAVLVCPGGSYSSLTASVKEGSNVALWLNARGVTSFVLRYRLGTSAGGGYHHPVQMWDVQRAMRWIRANAWRYGIDTARVGILGFSAGGHIAATGAMHWDGGNPDSTSPHYYPGVRDTIDNYSSRPAFQLVIYPVITMDNTYTHAGSRTALLGTSPSATLVNFTSNEMQVVANTPPAFIVHTVDDGIVPVRNSRTYRDSLTSKGVRYQYREYPNGPHGFGMADGQAGAPNTPALATWTTYAIEWLDSLNMRTPVAIGAGKVNARVGSVRSGLQLENGQVIAIPAGADPVDLRGRVIPTP